MFVLICLLVSILFVPLAHSQNADLYYQQGMDFAKLQRWEEAKKAFISGLHESPNDKRFPTELAGIAFRQHQNALAKSYLHRALKLDRNDNYVLEFLGTIYLLDRNLQAALLHWNKIGRPQIENIKISGNLKINASLLDHAFVFSPLSLLKLSDLEETMARLQLLEIFPRCSFELSSRSDEKFDLVFHALERNGAGDTTLGSLLSFFRGLPYLSIYPEFYNLRNQAINFSSLLRWDSDKRRIFLSLSGPIASDPKYRIRLNLDGRNEDWHIPSVPQGFRLKRAEASFGVDAILNAQWKVTNSIAFSDNTLEADLFNEGRAADYKIQLVHHYSFPEEKIDVRSFAGATVGRLFHHSSDVFSQIEAGSELQLSVMRASLRFAKSFGTIPFTHEYILGIDQDTDLWLRAHNGLRKQKGALPMGRDFVLINWEADKQIYRHPFFQVKVGPFIDSGRTYDTSPLLGAHKWLFDAGFQTKLRVLNAVTTVLVVGRDISSRRNTYYLNIQK